MEKLRVQIDDLSRGGPGVVRARSGHPVVFVPKSAPGDQGWVQIQTKKKQYWIAEVKKWDELARNRVKPKCEFFDECGGCDWQHLAYGHQWQVKVEGVRWALRKSLGLKAITWELFPSSIAWGYRNRIQLHWDGVRFGYFKHRSKTIVDIQSCEIAHTKISQQIPKLKKMLQDQGASVGTYEIRLTSDGRVVMGTRSAFGFRQVHEAQNQFLRNWVQNHAGAPQCVLDLYSGDGNLSESIGSPRICVDVATPSLASPKAVDVKTRWVHAAVGDWLKRPQSKKVASEADLLILDPKHK